MEQREKLIELIKESDWFAVEFDRSGDASFAINFREIADHLLANGVVVLPCRCEECEYHTLEEPGMVYCPHLVGGWVSNGDFCSGAKRKGGDE